MSTTINKEEIQKFSKLADEWWDVSGKFKPLHMFNPIRIEYITENIKKYFRITKNQGNFLAGLKKSPAPVSILILLILSFFASLMRCLIIFMPYPLFLNSSWTLIDLNSP